MKRKRKSPYEHPVRAHKRKGRPVVRYQRGKGDKPQQAVRQRKRRVVGGVNPGDPFTISFFYIGEPREEFTVDAKNYDGALGAGIEMRDKPLPPRLIRMRRGR